jgi:DNA ligase-1
MSTLFRPMLATEAIVVGFEEQMHNANVGRRNDVGRTVRSSAKAGKVGKGTLGALIVEGLPGQPFAGIRFSIGTGFDDELRAACWGQRAVLPGCIVRYRYFDIGIKDSPRFPTFQAFRTPFRERN